MAVRFDANTDQISRSTAPAIGTSGWTFLCWFYISVDRNDFSSIMRIWNSGSGTRGNAGTDSNGTTLAYFTGAGSITSSTNASVGAWYRYAISIPSTGGSTSTGTLYTATDIGAVSSASGSVQALNDANGLTIGGRGNGDGTEWFNGRVAYARMWTAALSQAEVEAEWASATPVITSGLWAHWPLLLASDLTDASGNGRNLSAGSTAVTTEDDPPVGGGTNHAGASIIASTFGMSISASLAAIAQATMPFTFGTSVGLNDLPGRLMGVSASAATIGGRTSSATTIKGV